MLGYDIPASCSLDRKSRQRKAMDGCFSTWKYFLSASGRWTALGWVVFALKGNLLIIIPKTPETDWLNFLWVLILISYWSLFKKKSCLFKFRVTNAGDVPLCRDVDWDRDWNRLRPVEHCVRAVPSGGGCVCHKKWCSPNVVRIFPAQFETMCKVQVTLRRNS